MLEPKYGDVSVTLDGHVATLEIHRPPHNFFDFNLIRDLADACEALDQQPECRALVLCSEGKSFCAGANFANRDASSGGPRRAPAKIRSMLKACGCSAVKSRSLPQFKALQSAEASDSRCRRLPHRDRRSSLRRELRQARHPPRLRPHLHAPASDRRAKGQSYVLHGAPRNRRRSARLGHLRFSRRAGQTPQ